MKPNAGIDYVAAQVGTTCFAALTANSATPASGDTTLTAEITTASGGLIRKAATYAHTNGTSTFTETVTFTANGSDALPVTPAKVGYFSASSSGSLIFEDLISSPPTLSNVGDSITLTNTITIT